MQKCKNGKKKAKKGKAKQGLIQDKDKTKFGLVK